MTNEKILEEIREVHRSIENVEAIGSQLTDMAAAAKERLADLYEKLTTS